MRWRDHGDAIRQRIGISLQETQFSDKLTVRETLTLFRSFYRRGIEPEEAIARVSLEEKAERLGEEALRRAEAAAGGGRGPGRRSGAVVSRRADDGPRSATRGGSCGRSSRVPPPGPHDPADHALHGRGRAALRPRGDRRPRPDHRPGVAARADRPAGRRARRRVLARNARRPRTCRPSPGATCRR